MTLLKNQIYVTELLKIINISTLDIAYFSHTFVPVLPELLLECLESPTPYIMGVIRSSNTRAMELDAVEVDLDIGAIYVPSTVTIPYIPEPFAQRLISSLQMVRSKNSS